MRGPHVGGKPILEWTPRHDSLDPIWLRLRTWKLVAQALPGVMPFGRRPLSADLRRYKGATGAQISDTYAFNEYLQVAYEHGIVGVVGVGGGLVLCGYLAGHTPFGTSLLVWALTMTGSVTLRVWPFPALGLLLILGALL